MSGEQQLWAARDWDGGLYQFNVEPENNGTEERPFFSAVNDEDDFNVLRLPDELLPDLKPGEKCRVTITRLVDERRRPQCPNCKVGLRRFTSELSKCPRCGRETANS